MADHSDSIYDQLVKLLDAGCARYQIVHHPEAGRSEEVAKARNTEVGQGAKALVCQLHLPNGDLQNVMAVMPADRKLDKQKLAAAFGAKKAKLLAPDETQEITRCKIGAIPPFAFDDRLRLVCDPRLLERYQVIAFNAGRLSTSILLHSEDYLKLAQPKLLAIADE